MEPMPFYGGISFLNFFAALGLPGLCGYRRSVCRTGMLEL